MNNFLEKKSKKEREYVIYGALNKINKRTTPRVYENIYSNQLKKDIPRSVEFKKGGKETALVKILNKLNIHKDN